MKPSEILELTFESNDLGKEVTIREYFYELMQALWTEGEGFSGKRPLGNSGWDFDIFACLVKNNLVTGTIDSDGYVSKLDYEQAFIFVQDVVIPALFAKP